MSSPVSSRLRALAEAVGMDGGTLADNQSYQEKFASAQIVAKNVTWHVFDA